MTRHELGRVLKHVDEAVQLAQDVVGQVAAGLGFAVHVDRHVGVLPAHLFDELAQVQHCGVEVGAGGEFFVIDGQDERAGTALLLGKLAQVAIAGNPQHLKAFFFNRLSQCADAQTRGVFRAEVLVDDDDGKAKFHPDTPTKRRIDGKWREV